MPGSGYDLGLHSLSWADFDALAAGTGGPDVVQVLRRAERSRRLLLLRALIDKVKEFPDLEGLVPPPYAALQLLMRVEQHAPEVLDLMIAHPYTGSWAGYSTRLLNNQTDGVCPQWMHVGHLHAIAAAGAIRAGIAFETGIPVWHGQAILPTLGMAHVSVDSPCSAAEVRGDGDTVEISTRTSRIRLPRDLSSDTPDWWTIRGLKASANGYRLGICLDDVDPYRGLYEPVAPQRLSETEVNAWQTLLQNAWQLIARLLPDNAEAMTAGLDSLVPRPAVPFGNPSASTGEAFGSAVIAMPADAESLAATLVHEFNHIRLDGLLHLAKLYEHDPRERFYTPWRDDPRPISGVLQGVYAFFGVTAFWRALANSPGTADAGRASFEFAYWRSGTWRTLQALRNDSNLTDAGRRFVNGIAVQLEPWQGEPVPADIADWAATVADDDYAGWRIRYLRPSNELVSRLADGWLHGRRWPVELTIDRDPVPTPVPDGAWTDARTQLVRLRFTGFEPELVSKVPGATAADIAFVSGRLSDAAAGYRSGLAEDPDRPVSWVGLGLAMAATGSNPTAARALLRSPEVVRSVHRQIRKSSGDSPAPEELATWIGRYMR
jgi:HEXXH motif-containing protein